MEIVHILLQDFSHHLTIQNASASTIKNYLADIALFFRFLENHDQPVSLLTLPHQLSDANISHYHQYLVSRFPLPTVKRRISSLNKFISFAKKPGEVLPTNQVTNIPLPPPSPPPPSPVTKPRFNYYLALLILLTISLSIIGGFVASQLTPWAPIGLVDPSTTPLLP